MYKYKKTVAFYNKNVFNVKYKYSQLILRTVQYVLVKDIFVNDCCVLLCLFTFFDVLYLCCSEDDNFI